MGNLQHLFKQPEHLTFSLQESERKTQHSQGQVEEVVQQKTLQISESLELLQDQMAKYLATISEQEDKLQLYQKETQKLQY